MATHHHPSLLAVLLLAIACGSCCVQGVEWVKGDVFASAGYPGRLVVFTSSLVEKDTIDLSSECSDELTGGAFNRELTILYVTCFEASTVIAVNATGAHEVLFTFASGVSPESIAFDKNGDMYVGHADGDKKVYKHAPTADGTLLAQFQVQTADRGSDWIDLSLDETIILSTSEGDQVFRFNITSNSILSPFATGLPEPCYALRVLRDGSVIVACYGALVLLDATGSIRNTFSPASSPVLFAANIDPTEQFVYTAATNGQVWRVDLADFDTNITLATGYDIGGLTVLGETSRNFCSGACCNETTNTFLPAGTVCRPAAGQCDVAEVCTADPNVADATFCPPDAFKQGDICRRAADACDATERCNGTSAICPDDVSAPDGTTCPFFGHQDESRKHGYPYSVDASPLQRKVVGKEEAATLDAALFNEGRMCWGKCLGGQCYMSRRERSCCYTPSLAEAQGVGAEAQHEDARLFCWN